MTSSPMSLREHLLDVGNDGVQIESPRLQDLPAAEREELPGEGGRALAGETDLPELGPEALVLELRLHEIRVAENRGEEIVEVVRDTAREAADPLHLLRLYELFFEPALLDRGAAKIGRGPLGRDAVVHLRARDREDRAAHDQTRHQEKGDTVRAGAGVESGHGRHGQGPHGAGHHERGSPFESRRFGARAVLIGTVKQIFRIRLQSGVNLVTNAVPSLTREDRVQEIVGAERGVHESFQRGAAVAHRPGRHPATIAGHVDDEPHPSLVVDEDDPARGDRKAGVPRAVHGRPPNGLAVHVVAHRDPVPDVLRLEEDHGLVFVPVPFGPHAKVRDLLAHRRDQRVLVLPEGPSSDPHPLDPRIRSPGAPSRR